MYHTHFGLTQAPFKITPNTDFFFAGGERGAILDALLYAIGHGEGIVKVTGEVGSGKTMLCRMLQTRLPDSIETVYLANPNVSPEDILHAIAFELQLPISPQSSRLEVMQALQEHLLARHAQGKQVVVFVEEAQGMPLATLEEIRLLSNLETQHDKLLQIVLFGQPELNQNISQTHIRQLKERITHSFDLPPLRVDDIREYLMFRLRTAGYRGPDLFGAAVVRYIARASQGLTRRVNIIADKTLLAAFADQSHNIALKHVRAAVRDSEFSDSNTWWPLPGALRTWMTLGLVIVLIFMFAMLSPYFSSAPNRPLRVAQAPAPQQPAVSRSVPAIPIAAIPARADLLDTRLAATQTWLAQQPSNTFSIQMLGSNNPEELRSALVEIGRAIEMDQVFVYRTTAHGKPSLTVLAGSYPNRNEASKALAALPAALKRYQPYLRSVQGIRAEIGQARPSSP